MSFESFHFLRPTWLAALLLLVPLLAWARRRHRNSAGWKRICDPHLLRHLLTIPAGRSARWPLALFALGWVSTSIALAGPTWQRLPRTAFEQPSRTVLVLGLAPSMNQRDVAPSRLARARHKLQDALDQMNGGSVALVVYREEAFPATPLTDDTRVLRESIPLLETNLTPGRAVLPARGIEVAAELLKPVGLSGAQILLVTDGADDDPAATRAAAGKVARAGARLSVLGIAGEDATLASVASAGHGAFSELSADGRDLDRLLGTGGSTFGASLVKSEIRTDEWRDLGAWLVWIPLLLAPLAFRKGWATAALFALLIQLPAGSAEAGIRDWFERADQRGSRAFAADQYEAAAESFEDPAWQAAARYRAGDFAGASEALASRSDPQSQYNLGNALAKAGHLDEAMTAYERVLATNPEDEDARFNRDLVKRLLDQRQKQNPSPSGDSSGNGEGSDEGGEPKSQEEAGSSTGSDRGSAANERSSDPSATSEAASQNEGGAEQANAAPDRSSHAEEGQAADGSGDPATQGAASSETEENEADADSSVASVGTEPRTGSDAQISPSRSGASDATADARQTEGARPVESGAPPSVAPPSPRERDMARWMRRLPDDPGGLLREKIRRDYLRKQEMRLRRGGRL